MAVMGEGDALARKVKARIMFRIRPGGRWLLDLSEDGLASQELDAGGGSRLRELREGEKPKCDVVLAVSDDDFMDMVAGTSSAQGLWMSGKLKVKGSLAVAGRIGPVFAAAKRFASGGGGSKAKL